MVRTTPAMTNMIHVTYGYARVSKSDQDDRDLANQGIRQEHIFSGQMTGRVMSRPGWDELMARVQPNDTIVVVRLRHDERTQAYLRRRTTEGMSKAEVIRCLKRYVAREVFSALRNSTPIAHRSH